MFQEAINNYLQSHGYNTINLKAVLFDMDGVLFNSMPNHAESWHKVMLRFGFGLSRDEAYMHEGRTGASTINIVSRRERGHDATEEEIKALEKGVKIEDYVSGKAKVKILKIDEEKDVSRIEIIIHEGKNREVRKMCNAIGKKVLALHRSRIGNLNVKDLKIGEWKYLNNKQIESLIK